MRRWLETLRDKPRVVTWLARGLAVFLSAFILAFFYNGGALGEAKIPAWVFWLAGITSLVLLFVFVGLRAVEKKYVLPSPTSEALEQERLSKETSMREAKQDNELALEAEAFIFALLKQHGIAVTRVPMSAMAQDWAGAFYTFERPIILPKDFVFPTNRVLHGIQHSEGEKRVVTGFEISSVHLHTYATFSLPHKLSSKS